MMLATDLAAHWNLHPVPRRREWRGRCPACGYDGAAVLTERNGRPLLWCASCQDRAALVAMLKGAGGDVSPPAFAREPVPVADSSWKRRRALAIWNGAEPIPGTPAERYLRRRALPELVNVPALRFRADTPRPGGGRHAAMLALVVDVAGNPMAAHRTFITPDGRKAFGEPVKASLGSVMGGAIRLAPPAPEIAIAEGIETSAAAGIILGLPAWSAISAGNLARALVLPPAMRSVVIAADHDPAGRRAADLAAERWRAEGRRVRIAMPDRLGDDFADVLMRREGGAA
ncbi:DUF7146 domain-containing protein [Acidithiobacillus sp.]|uniref:DUF7146 domain-containing protein n=1 Tax=Acidithiobacillus sp. TaxID=1872118 RepID=UPI003D053500